MTRIGSLCGALFLVGALTTACSGASAPGTSYGAGTSAQATTSRAAEISAAPAAAGSTITIKGMAFGEPLVVAPGSTVTIVNEDSVEHSVTAKPGTAFDTDVDGGGQKTFTAPTQPGEYPFICTYHPNMKGTLIVK